MMTKEFLHRKGNIDVRRYLAFGDSITAGYTNGALFYEGQENSYANIIAKQLQLIGGGDFKQPLMPPDSVGVDQYGNAPLVLKNASHNSEKMNYSMCRLQAQGDALALSTNVFYTQGPFNNSSVAGAKVTTSLIKGLGDSSKGNGNYNPFFARMTSNPSKASILSDALLIDSTFFSLFIGNNDALAYALAGGTTDSITPPTEKKGIGFDTCISEIVDSLCVNGAKGVIANIPDLNSLPYFTSIPYNGLFLDSHKTSLLNEKYNASGIYFHVGKNPFLIQDPAVKSVGIRLAMKGELILLDVLLDENKLQYLNSDLPIPKKYVLTVNETAKVQSAITNYNKIIKSIADTKDLAFVDVNALVKMAKKDRVYNSVTYNLNYVKKGVFSLDGLHLTPFGQALLANEFIKAINTKYGSAIPLVKSVKYEGIKFPA